MGLFSSVTNALTGGMNNKASSALNSGYDAWRALKSPTAEQLTLPELQKYVDMGILTPAQAETILQQGNAYNDINVDPSSMMEQQDALSKLKGVGDSKGMTDAMKARLTEALDKVATETRGNNASILDQMAQRGIPTSLMGAAAQMASSGDEARNANLTATQAAGDAENRAIQSMMAQGDLATSMHGQQYNEQANKAAAENAMRQWNAGASNQMNEANANREQAANVYNTENKQNIANANTGLANQRTAYNATVPQSVFNNDVTRAQGLAGMGQAQANQYNQVGNQILGLIGAGAGAAAGMGAKGPQAPAKAPSGYNPDISEDMLPGHAGGAIIPGQAKFPGDSPMNDTVHARLSPGEAVIPRSVMNSSNAPDRAKSFVNRLLKDKPTKAVHEDDIQSVLKALSKMREGEIQHLDMDSGIMSVKKGKENKEPFYTPPQKNARIVTGATRG